MGTLIGLIVAGVLFSVFVGFVGYVVAGPIVNFILAPLDDDENRN